MCVCVCVCVCDCVLPGDELVRRLGGWGKGGGGLGGGGGGYNVRQWEKHNRDMAGPVATPRALQAQWL